MATIEFKKGQTLSQLSGNEYLKYQGQILDAKGNPVKNLNDIKYGQKYTVPDELAEKIKAHLEKSTFSAKGPPLAPDAEPNPGDLQDSNMGLRRPAVLEPSDFENVGPPDPSGDKEVAALLKQLKIELQKSRASPIPSNIKDVSLSNVGNIRGDQAGSHSAMGLGGQRKATGGFPLLAMSGLNLSDGDLKKLQENVDKRFATHRMFMTGGKETLEDLAGPGAGTKYKGQVLDAITGEPLGELKYLPVDRPLLFPKSLLADKDRQVFAENFLDRDGKLNAQRFLVEGKPRSGYDFNDLLPEYRQEILLADKNNEKILFANDKNAYSQFGNALNKMGKSPSREDFLKSLTAVLSNAQLLLTNNRGLPEMPAQKLSEAEVFVLLDRYSGVNKDLVQKLLRSSDFQDFHTVYNNATNPDPGWIRG